jgi:homoserine O-acetyltransferase
MVDAEYLLLTKVLGIEHVRAMLGVSMGAMQCFQWMASYPDFMDKGVTIVGTPRMGERDILLWSSFFNIGKTNKDAAEAEKADPAEKPKSALEKWLGILSQGSTYYEKYRQPFNPLRQFSAIARHDIGRSFDSSLDKAAATIRAKSLAVIATKDKALSPETAMEFAKVLKSEVVEMNGPCGHNAYKCEIELISKPIDDFLSK